MRLLLWMPGGQLFVLFGAYFPAAILAAILAAIVTTVWRWPVLFGAFLHCQFRVGSRLDR